MRRGLQSRWGIDSDDAPCLALARSAEGEVGGGAFEVSNELSQ